MQVDPSVWELVRLPRSIVHKGGAWLSAINDLYERAYLYKWISVLRESRTRIASRRE